MFGTRGTLFLLVMAAVLLQEGCGARKGRRRDRGRTAGPLASQVRPTVLAPPATPELPGPSPNTSLSQGYPVLTPFDQPRPDVQVGCKELRSKRYISDGFCTSIKPVTEVVCTGHCLPMRNLPWYAEFIKVWARTKVLEWRCVDDVVKRKRVRLICENGETRTYRIKVVKSCKCKRYMRQQNQSLVPVHGRNAASHHRRRQDRKDSRSNRVQH